MQFYEKCRLLLLGFTETSVFWPGFQKNAKRFKYEVYWKSVQWYTLSAAFLKNQNIPHLISILSEFRPTENVTTVLTIQLLPLFWNTRILVTSSFIFHSDLFHYYSKAIKCLTWPTPRWSYGQKFELARQLWYMYHKCRPFQPPWFCTLIIRDYTYYDVLFM